MAISKPTKTSRKGKTVQPTKKIVVEEPTTDPESPVESESDEVPVIKKVIKKKIIKKKVVKKVAEKPAVTKDTAKSKKTVKSKKKREPEPTSNVEEGDKSQESQDESQEEPVEEPTQESEPEVSSQEPEAQPSPQKPKRKATKAPPKSKAFSPIKKQKSTARRTNIAEPDTQESEGSQSPGPKVSEQDSLSIHVPNHTMNDPSITMNEMVFNAIKKELSENGKDTFTYQSIEKRMKIEGSDTVRKCIKALLEERVLENKKKSEKVHREDARPVRVDEGELLRSPRTINGATNPRCSTGKPSRGDVHGKRSQRCSAKSKFNREKTEQGCGVKNQSSKRQNDEKSSSRG
jgi:hypothetical protein